MRTRTRRWPTRVILHLQSMCLVNAWLTYREKQRKNKSKKILDLLAFRECVAESLLNAELDQNRPRGRPSLDSLLNYTEEIPKKKARAAVLPNADVRFDGYDHWPDVNPLSSAQRCKLEICGKKSRTRCLKCNVYLCLSSERNCFKYFHTK